jgi:hypothetical protein
MSNMREPHFTEVHLSGLWDAPRPRWVALIKAAAYEADVITITEFTQLPIGAWTPDGFELIYYPGQGRNECAILYKTKTFPRVLDRWCIPISRTPYALGSGKIRPRIHLLGAELEHVSGERANIEVWHAPSAIEGKNGLIRGVRRVKALFEALTAINLHRKAELRGEANVLAADWNLNLKRPWVAALLRAKLRGLRNAWRIWPQGGSHGDRLIDGIRVSRKLRIVGSSRLAKPFAPFDHRMVMTELAWVKR